MSKIYVSGMGAMGTPVAYALDKLGHDVWFIEPNRCQRKAAIDSLKAAGFKGKIRGCFAGTLGNKFFDVHPDVDLVISTTPFHLNGKQAALCLRNSVAYCDLGGNPEVANAIHLMAMATNTTPVFTDLGLAPGHLNILAEHVASEHSPEVLRLYCGGLPAHPTNRIGYNLVFSVKGLVNEYRGQCEILKDGEIVEVEALTGKGVEGKVRRDTKEYDLEGFYTRGALSKGPLLSLKKKGVKNCCYKTIRYSGHVDYIQFLMHDCKLSDAELYTALSNACEPTTKDVVYMGITFGEPEEFAYTALMGLAEADEHWTAMQKTTAFPAAVVASMMTEGEISDKKVLTYADVDYTRYIELLTQIDTTVPWELE